MRKTIINARLGAVLGFILFLPFFLAFTISISDIEPVAGTLKSLTTEVSGELNTFGRLLMFGGVLALPVALLVSLFSMLTKRGIDQGISFRPRMANFVVAVLAVLGIVVVAEFAIREAINCSAKVICD